MRQVEGSHFCCSGRQSQMWLGRPIVLFLQNPISYGCIFLMFWKNRVGYSCVWEASLNSRFLTNFRLFNSLTFGCYGSTAYSIFIFVDFTTKRLGKELHLCCHHFNIFIGTSFFLFTISFLRRIAIISPVYYDIILSPTWVQNTLSS